MKALSHAQQRALLAFPRGGPMGGTGYGWWRDWNEITTIAGPHVPRRTVEILIERGYAERYSRDPDFVALTPAGRGRRSEIARSAPTPGKAQR